MKTSTIRLEDQLKLGFGCLLLLVLVLGGVAAFQTKAIQDQLDTLYNHPLQVRRAIGDFRADLLSVDRNMKELFLPGQSEPPEAILQRNAELLANASEHLRLIKEQFLGPPADVEAVREALVSWSTMLGETIRLLQVGQGDEAVRRTLSSGTPAYQQRVLFAALAVVDAFARNKGDSLYLQSQSLHQALNLQLAVLVTLFVGLALGISTLLLRNIRTPLAELTRASGQFHQGDRSARSLYVRRDEFGDLSDSFNTLAEKMQAKLSLDERSAALSALMLREDETKGFFQATLQALLLNTGSQMGAVFLLSADKKNYLPFETIGLEKAFRLSFDAGLKEGEFGTALATRQVQLIRDIREDTRFAFLTVSGRFLPREILTIPIVVENEVAAVYSLATIGTYSVPALTLIDQVQATFSARVGGILANQRLQDLFRKVAQQNQELEAQKNELASQASELIQQNSELEMQKNQLGEASRLKTSFLSNMSHELRTPLNSVIALTSVLHRRLADRIPPEEFGYLEVIDRNGKHLLGLINDLLDIARIESGQEVVEVTTFEVHTLVAEVVALLGPQADLKGIELRHHREGGAMSISSDRERCRHILENLVGNAVKFTPAGRVEIAVRDRGTELEIVVSDTGIGIADQHLPHIFDEFRQADSGTARKFGGTGLGLALVKKHTTILGGRVSVNSTVGQGSVFTLTLPRPRVPTPGTGQTVLLVEDSEPAIVQLKDILEEQSYRTLVARDGAEALKIIADVIPDAMILDLMMPGIDGFEVLQTLRNAEPTAHIPVLILTARHISKDELQFLKRNNIHQLIQKGDVNRVDLLAAVAAMVRRHDA